MRRTEEEREYLESKILPETLQSSLGLFNQVKLPYKLSLIFIDLRIILLSRYQPIYPDETLQ